MLDQEKRESELFVTKSEREKDCVMCNKERERERERERIGCNKERKKELCVCNKERDTVYLVKQRDRERSLKSFVLDVGR